MTEPVVTAEMIEAAARQIGAWITYDDHGGPDTEVLADLLPGTYEQANGAIAEIAEAALLAALRLAPSPWRPIAEAPRDGTPILATLAVFRTKDHVLLYWDTRVIWADDETGEIDRACEDDWQWDDYTHWMPLPQPPGDEP